MAKAEIFDEYNAVRKGDVVPADDIPYLASNRLNAVTESYDPNVDEEADDDDNVSTGYFPEWNKAEILMAAAENQPSEAYLNTRAILAEAVKNKYFNTARITITVDRDGKEFQINMPVGEFLANAVYKVAMTVEERKQIIAEFLPPVKADETTPRRIGSRALTQEAQLYSDDDDGRAGVDYAKRAAHDY